MNASAYGVRSTALADAKKSQRATVAPRKPLIKGMCKSLERASHEQTASFSLHMPLCQFNKAIYTTLHVAKALQSHWLCWLFTLASSMNPPHPPFF